VIFDDDEFMYIKVGDGTKKKISRSSEGLSQLQGESVGGPIFVPSTTIPSKSTVKTVSRHKWDDVKLTISSNSTGYANDGLQTARGSNGRTTERASTA
jgi:hypothetical protein